MMRKERRQPTKAELARITSNKPVVRRISPAERKDVDQSRTHREYRPESQDRGEGSR